MRVYHSRSGDGNSREECALLFNPEPTATAGGISRSSRITFAVAVGSGLNENSSRRPASGQRGDFEPDQFLDQRCRLRPVLGAGRE